MSKLVFLTGMSGSGKSYWARKIAQAYYFQGVYLDKKIEQQELISISELILQKGEDSFRSIEHETLKQVIAAAKSPTVIACGGGTPCFFNNMELMKRAGTVVYLQASVDFLKRKLVHSYSRPLLQKENLEEDIIQMLLKRMDIYEQANYILPVENLSITNFEQIIL